MARKYALEAAKTTRCASNCWPLACRVTSQSDLANRKLAMPPKARPAWLSSRLTEYREEDIFQFSKLISKSSNIKHRCHGDTMFRIQEAIIQGGDLERVLEDVEKEERDWEWRGKDGRTMLELASMLGRSEMVKLLVAAGASPNSRSTAGQ